MASWGKLNAIIAFESASNVKKMGKTGIDYTLVSLLVRVLGFLALLEFGRLLDVHDLEFYNVSIGLIKPS